MCMVYKGIAYPYAFEFNNVLIRNEPRTFRIVVSEYREITQDFTGLCFENELKVTSSLKLPYGAFFEIINKVVNITSEGEQFYIEKYNKAPEPLMSVKDAGIIELFEKRKKQQKSLVYYEELKRFFEKPPEAILKQPEDKQLDIVDSIIILLLANMIRTQAPQLNNFSFFRT